jgi:hypothetical protein
MADYNALQEYQETKNFESYLLIRHCIEKECRSGILDALIEKLTKVYQAGGKEDELMVVLQ